jgi:hypothetical protein
MVDLTDIRLVMLSLIPLVLWCPAELIQSKLCLVVEIDFFFLDLNRSISALEFYRICSNRSLVCTRKLAKVCCLRNTSRDGYRERG